MPYTVPYDGRAIAFQSGRYMETVGESSLRLTCAIMLNQLLQAG